MPAVVVEIAEAVVDVLNDATLSQTFTASRAYAPVFGVQDEDEDDLEELQVIVVPRELTAVPLARKSSMFDYVIDIGICKRSADTNALIDPLVLFAQEVMDLFRGKELEGYEQAKCVAVANNPIYDFAALTQNKAFMSLVTLTFSKSRDVS